GIEVAYLPAVRSVTFQAARYGVPWEALKLLLRTPQITSITFSDSATFTRVAPFPADAFSMTFTLEELSYPTLIQTVVVKQSMGHLVTMSDRREVKMTCLSPLVLGMRQTARALTLPMETSPLREMACLDWPEMRRLHLGGSFSRDADQWIPTALPTLVRRMTNLQHLELTAALPIWTTILCPVLGRAPLTGSFELRHLRSLTIAHPDPEDAIFSTELPSLTRLSLRDYPRHYDGRAEPYYYERWRSPIPSATRVLSMLRRMRPYGLTELELVYSADESDSELLDFVTDRLPMLRHLELHRYRRTSHDIVKYRDIVRKLSTIPTLVTLRLNLDFEDDPGPYIGDEEPPGFSRYHSRLIKLGWEILDLLDPCPRLEHVALVSHGTQPPSIWRPFYRSRRDARVPHGDRVNM
ncbi:hypothetical protein C8Q77DRAFT_1055931, partial [Trametes polyzona]